MLEAHEQEAHSKKGSVRKASSDKEGREHSRGSESKRSRTHEEQFIENEKFLEKVGTSSKRAEGCVLVGKAGEAVVCSDRSRSCSLTPRSAPLPRTLGEPKPRRPPTPTRRAQPPTPPAPPIRCKARHEHPPQLPLEPTKVMQRAEEEFMPTGNSPRPWPTFATTCAKAESNRLTFLQRISGRIS